MSTGAVIRRDAAVLENVVDGGPNRRLRLEVGVDWPESAPGQFVMLSPGALPAAPRLDPLLPRPMAIFRREGAALDVLYKVTGRGTALLAAALPGERVRTVGPLGCGFPEPAPGVRVALVGGGTGLASLFDVAARALRRGPVVALLGARRAEDLMALAAFRALGVELRLATDDGSAGRRGLVTDLLAEALAEGVDGVDGVDAVYACGPTPMMQRAAALAAGAGRPCFLSLENRMACGFGVCLGCAVPRREAGYALVCRDGPVFEAGALRVDGLP